MDKPVWPTVGSIVHYTAKNGACVPALVLSVFSSLKGEFDLKVFDYSQVGVNGGREFISMETKWSEKPRPGTWHMPEPQNEEQL